MNKTWFLRVTNNARLPSLSLCSIIINPMLFVTKSTLFQDYHFDNHVNIDRQ